VSLLRAYGTADWEERLAHFRANLGDLADRLSKAREMQLVPVQLPTGNELRLSPGPHNQLQKEIVENFLPRFVPGGELLYLGDAQQKLLYVAEQRLTALGLPLPGRSTLPDVIALDTKNGWIFLSKRFTALEQSRMRGASFFAGSLGRATAR
jgi:hypothetical protein